MTKSPSAGLASSRLECLYIAINNNINIGVRMEWYVQVGVASTLVTVAIISFMVLSDFVGFGDSKFKVDGRVSIVYDFL
jgi:hypothetical protein